MLYLLWKIVYSILSGLSKIIINSLLNLLKRCVPITILISYMVY